MNKTLQAIIILIVLSLSTSLYGQQGSSQPFGTNSGQGGNSQPSTPSQFDTLKSQYQHDVQAVVKPIHDNYILALNALMKNLTQSGNLDEALAVQLELKSTQSQPTPSYVDQAGSGQKPAGGMPSQLDNLKSKYQSDVNTAIKPIQDRYTLALNNLLKLSTQTGNLDEAVAARDELKSMTTAQPSGTEAKGAVQTAGANGPGPGWYYVQSQVSALYLHVFKGRHQAGTHVDQDKKSGDQVWKFIPDGKGDYFIQSKIGELFLDSKPTADDNMDIVNQTSDLVWKLIPDGNGNYFIKSEATGNDLDVFGAYKDLGGKIHQAPQDPKQVWKLIKTEGDSNP